MDSLKEKTAKGLFWGAINSGTTQLLNILIGFFLARLLFPSDYGIVGLLAIFTAIAGNLQDSGFSTALINIKDIKDKDYNAVFWFNILMSIGIYAVLFFCAPLIADYFQQPALIALSRFVFLAFVISSFGIAQGAYLFRNLMNKEKAIITFAAMTGSGGVGLFLAFNGYGYWSLAWQQVLYITITNIGRFYYSSWRPSFHIDFSPIRKMFGFSNKILITTVINSINQNILSFIFGKLFPISTVGNYTQANNWNNKAFSFVGNTVAQVAQPVLSSINDDRDRERRVFRKMMRFTAFIAFPALFGLSMVGHEFIIILIKEKWADCIPLLQIMCIGGAFMPFLTLYQNLSFSHERSDIFMWCTLSQLGLQLLLLFVTYPYGILTMVAAYTLFNILWLGVWQHFAKKMIGVSFGQSLKDIAPFLLTTTFVMGFTYVSTLWIDSLLPLLIVRVVMASILYIGIMTFLHIDIMDECVSFLKAKTRKKQ